ncbi:MAG: hypothetical protein V7L12_04890 [Nostoc sp.]
MRFYRWFKCDRDRVWQKSVPNRRMRSPSVRNLGYRATKAFKRRVAYHTVE